MIKNRARWMVLMLCAVLVLVFGLNLAGVLYFKYFSKADCGEYYVPKIKIDLGETTLDELNTGDKETKHENNTLEINGCDEMLYYSSVEIKGRGNSTWGQDKNPYQIKFDEKIDLFGMGKARKWVFLANYFDPSNMRADLAFYLEGLLGEPYALKGQFVELTIDGDYLGLYYVTPKVEIGKTRVDLRDPYALLIELDNLHLYEDNFVVEGNHFQLKDAVADDYALVAQADFAKDLERLKIAVDDKDIDKVAEIVDLDSMVRYYLLSELIVNPDAYSSSFYMYKDGLDDKIHFGPGWDFDYGFGNRRWIWADSDNYYSPFEMTIREYYYGNSGNAYFVVQSEEFFDLVGKMYREKISPYAQELLEYFDKRVEQISEVAVNNARRWDEDFWADVKSLRDWLEKRLKYFDEVYGTERVLKSYVII